MARKVVEGGVHKPNIAAGHGRALGGTVPKEVKARSISLPRRVTGVQSPLMFKDPQPTLASPSSAPHLNPLGSPLDLLFILLDDPFPRPLKDRRKEGLHSSGPQVSLSLLPRQGQGLDRYR